MAGRMRTAFAIGLVLLLVIGGGLLWVDRQFEEPEAVYVASLVRFLTAKSILGVFAHPDDEILVAGLLSDGASTEGTRVKTITFTQGEAGGGDQPISKSEHLGIVRVAELYKFGAMLSFALAHLSLLGLRIRQPEMKRPFKVGWNIRVGRYELPVTALVGLLGTAAVWVDVILTKPAGRNLGFLWMGIGLVFYLWYRRQQKLPVAARVDIEKLKATDYAPVTVKKILVPLRGGGSDDMVQFALRLAKIQGAELTALYVIEIAHALPLDTFFPEKLAVADSVMERAEAIGHEYDLAVDTQVKQARFAGEAIVELARNEQFDIVFLGARPQALSSAPGRTSFGTTVEYVVRQAPCRVWIFTGKETTPRK